MAAAIGDDPKRRRKPEPDGVNEAMRVLGVNAGDVAYVGDSEVDVATAKNAGLHLCAVSWGYRDVDTLKAAGADVICATPDELLAALEAI